MGWLFYKKFYMSAQLVYTKQLGTTQVSQLMAVFYDSWHHPFQQISLPSPAKLPNANIDRVNPYKYLKKLEF